MSYHLAEVNVARMNTVFDDPVMSGFVQRLQEINALADNSQGFIWRFQSETGDATYLRPFEDDRILFNLSVWESIEDLKNYVYNSRHVELLKTKHHWFAKPDEANLAMWWIEKGHIPTVDEALARLSMIRANGPSPQAFNFAESYAAPGDI